MPVSHLVYCVRIWCGYEYVFFVHFRSILSTAPKQLIWNTNLCTNTCWHGSATDGKAGFCMFFSWLSSSALHGGSIKVLSLIKCALCAQAIFDILSSLSPFIRCSYLASLERLFLCRSALSIAALRSLLCLCSAKFLYRMGSSYRLHRRTCYTKKKTPRWISEVLKVAVRVFIASLFVRESPCF